jgi:hypothetical protein
MKHKEKNMLIAFLAIVLLAVFADASGFVDVPFLNFQKEEPVITTTPTTPTTTTTSQYISGIITTDVAAFDSLDIATTRTVGTNVNCYWYAYRNGWVLLGSGDGVDISVEEADRNTIYAVVSVPSGQSYYVDYQKIISMNTRAQSVDYKDIDGDNVEEWVFKLDISGIPYASGTGKYSLPSFNIYLLSDDTGSFAFPTAGKPADLTSVGTTKVTKYLEWYMAMSAEKKAVALSKVVLSVNTSDISKVALKKLNIPGIGYLDGSSFEQDVLTSSIKWTYTISNTLYGADYIKLPVNSLNKFEFTTAVELDLASGDVLQFTLTVYQFDATESQVSDSDSVIVSA